MSLRRSVLLGLLGNGIAASSSPSLHEAEGREQGVALVYRTIDFEKEKFDSADLQHVLRYAAALGFDGVNVTHPFKADIVAHLTEADDSVSLLGAANTVLFRQGRIVGRNTDLLGFMLAFRRDLLGARLERVAQFGAGGAGASVAYALLELGAQTLSIYDTSPPRSAALAAKLQARFPDRHVSAVSSANEAVSRADGVVNATPVGMSAHPGMPLSADLLAPHLWVADIVYFPLVTELLASARALGCRTMNGRAMVVFQAAAAFRHFTGLEPDQERMLRSFRSQSPIGAGDAAPRFEARHAC